MKGLPYEVKALVQKSRESALLAVETYNRPTASFRSGAFVVLMVISWTALFHAIFFRKRVKPFYRKKDSRRYERIDGVPKRWELAECLSYFYGANNPPIRKNLEFFIGLRNKIEHHSLAQIDSAIFGECQAMLLNFENMLISEFGEKFALRAGLTFALQISKASMRGQLISSAQKKAFKEVHEYINAFRSALSTETHNSLEYSFKVFLVPKIGNHASSDAVAIEWIKYDPSKPEEMKNYERVVAMIKPKEVSVVNFGLLKPKGVAAEVARQLAKRFTPNDHAKCWRHFNARPVKGSSNPAACDLRYCYYDVLHKDYCYKKEWVDFLVERLKDEKFYSTIINGGVSI